MAENKVENKTKKSIDKEKSKTFKVYLVFFAIVLVAMFVFSVLNIEIQKRASFFVGYILLPTAIGFSFYYFPKYIDWETDRKEFFQNLGMEIIGAEVFFIILIISGLIDV